MSKKKKQNSNGIKVNDSIVMSVKKRKGNYRRLEAVIIAVIGYVSVIMAFLTMFDTNYNKTTLLVAGTIFSAVYITLSLLGKKGAWLITGSLILVMIMAYRVVDTLALGFKFVYNVIYHAAYHTDISYYKALKPRFEESSVTMFFIFMMWILAVVIYFFTIYRPNPFLPLLATFPIIEIGLYYGIEISIFWGILVIAYWLALLAMSSIDMGEYSGGNGGFVRKDDLFFPKRQMRLKVTEKCGLFVIGSVAAVSLISTALISITGYKRSDELNQKRVDIRDAVASFSMENLADSLSNITSAFGFDIKYENHKLGNLDRLRYKNRVDLTVWVSQKYDGAIYLKDFTGSVYTSDEWKPLGGLVYDTELFKNFDGYDIHPQEFPSLFTEAAGSGSQPYSITVENKEKKNHTFVPYGIINDGRVEFTGDTSASTKTSDKNKYPFMFSPMKTEDAAAMLKTPTRNVYSVSSVEDSYWQSIIREYCTEHTLFSYDDYFSVDSGCGASTSMMYSHPKALMAQLMETDYEAFIRENYLQVPADPNMTEIRELFSDILEDAPGANNASDQIQILGRLRDRISEMAVYSLTPGRTPSNRDFVNYFLTENHKGYCTHFATAGVLLARMAGIPARYATGYVVVSEDFSSSNQNNDLSYTIDIKDNRSHAWAEVYLEGYGWVPFEFTAGYSEETINTSPATTTVTTTTDDSTRTTGTRGSRQTSQRTTRKGETKTTAARSVTTAANSRPAPHKEHKPLPMGVKSSIVGVLFLLAAAAFVYLRRRFILWRRNKRFTTGSSAERIGYMYSYAEELLKLHGLSRGNSSYADFARDTEKVLGGIRFDPGAFSSFIDICLATVFGGSTASETELKQCADFVRGLADTTYKMEDKPHKIAMLLISVLR